VDTVYLERAIRAMRDHGQTIDPTLLPHLSPLGWEHINLTGGYIWRHARKAPPAKIQAVQLHPPAQLDVLQPVEGEEAALNPAHFAECD
jgi:hypothetical protein